MLDLFRQKITIFIGHYGSGKTTIAVHLACQTQKESNQELALADIDVNNPYFRSRDWLEQFQKLNIDLIIPDQEIAFAEMPYLPKRIYSAFQEKKRLILDVGGLDVGTKVLGSLADQILKYPYQLWFVVNTFRPGTETCEEIIEMFLSLQALSRLTISGILHNSNLGEFTKATDFISRENEIYLVAEKLGISKVYNCVNETLIKDVINKVRFPILPIQTLNQFKS
jgi:energy-coupling factor transporter ATP-binding protein EcfA2